MGVSSDVVQRARARVGTVLNGKWRLERMLGIGGMAAVYAAVHRNQNRVAIKMLHAELCVDDNVKVRFLREGYAANTVGHPGAVAVHDDDVAQDGSAFLVMELLQGETLEDRAARKNLRLAPGEVLQLTDQLLEVLAAAHDQGIVHRDIKPDNLFLTTSGQLKVLDFGIARLLESTSGINNGATGAGTFMGTPAFMPPEQARGRWDEVDFRTDVWAVGATMYTLLSGTNVHEAETVTDQLVLAATAPAPSLGLVAPWLPAPVVELVDRALAYEKIRRWPGVRSMQVALRDASAFVDRVPDVSAPRVSLSVLEREREADTLAAPAELISDIARVSRPTSLVSAVTSASDRSLTGSKKRLRVSAMAAAAIAFVILIALVVMQTAPARVDVANTPAAADPRTSNARDSEESARNDEPALTRRPSVGATPLEVSSPAKDAGASGNPDVPIGSPSRRSRSAVRLGPHPVPASARPANPGAAAGSPQTNDPFEKRY